MNGNIKAPAANGGQWTHFTAASYKSSSAETTEPASWFNPRRRFYAERLLRFVWWHGSKLFINDKAYADLAHAERLDRYAVDQAADDLYRLGCIEVRLAGETVVLHLLSADLDRLAGLAGRMVRS